MTHVVGPVVDPGFNPQARDYKLFIISCLQAITTTIVVMLRSSNDLVLEFSQSSGFGSRLRSLTGKFETLSTLGSFARTS